MIKCTRGLPLPAQNESPSVAGKAGVREALTPRSAHPRPSTKVTAPPPLSQTPLETEDQRKEPAC